MAVVAIAQMDRHGLGEGGEVSMRIWASYRPVAVLNAADLEVEALSGLIGARKAAEGVEAKPERVRSFCSFHQHPATPGSDSSDIPGGDAA